MRAPVWGLGVAKMERCSLRGRLCAASARAWDVSCTSRLELLTQQIGLFLRKMGTHFSLLSVAQAQVGKPVKETEPSVVGYRL